MRSWVIMLALLSWLALRPSEASSVSAIESASWMSRWSDASSWADVGSNGARSPTRFWTAHSNSINGGSSEMQ